ncbi:MAG: SH3 domain-containing protein [Allosphingosinicella sp.]
MSKPIAAASACLVALSLSAAVAQTRRETPYWASITSSQAMMRTGPGRNYPGTWLYVRRDLPVRVVEVYQDWRKIEDPDGTRGWMFSRMLSEARTALVRGDAPRPMHAQPDDASPIRFRAEPGVVGQVSQCAGGWCRFDVQGRSGFIRLEHIWGVGSNETVG